jgi:hypothetical protein
MTVGFVFEHNHIQRPSGHGQGGGFYSRFFTEISNFGSIFSMLSLIRNKESNIQKTEHKNEIKNI